MLTIDGKGPTDSDYPYVGTLALIFKEKSKTGAIAKFVEFATSPAPHNAIKGAGGLPLVVSSPRASKALLMSS